MLEDAIFVIVSIIILAIIALAIWCLIFVLTHMFAHSATSWFLAYALQLKTSKVRHYTVYNLYENVTINDHKIKLQCL